jgi:hypothetical protein
LLFFVWKSDWKYQTHHPGISIIVIIDINILCFVFVFLLLFCCFLCFFVVLVCFFYCVFVVFCLNKRLKGPNTPPRNIDKFEFWLARRDSDAQSCLWCGTLSHLRAAHPWARLGIWVSASEPKFKFVNIPGWCVWSFQSLVQTKNNKNTIKKTN